jgi:hypothetical protein
MLVEFYGLHFEAPPGWVDITDDLEDKWPPTLAGPLVGGALQFSIARYKSGKLPNITMSDLRQILTNFCANLPQKFNEPVERAGSMNTIECVSYGEEDLVAVWHLSNGRDYVMATYTDVGPKYPETGYELSQARQLVASIEFSKI